MICLWWTSHWNIQLLISNKKARTRWSLTLLTLHYDKSKNKNPIKKKKIVSSKVICIMGWNGPTIVSLCALSISKRLDHVLDAQINDLLFAFSPWCKKSHHLHCHDNKIGERNLTATFHFNTSPFFIIFFFFYLFIFYVWKLGFISEMK